MASLMRHRGFRSAMLIRRAAISAYCERSSSENIRGFCSWSPLIFPRPASKPFYESKDQRSFSSPSFSFKRSYIATPNHVSTDQEWVKRQLSRMSGVSSFSLTRVDGKHIVIKAPSTAMCVTKSDECLNVSFGLNAVKGVTDLTASVHGNHFLIQAHSDGETYLIGVNLPPVWKTNSGFNGLVRNGPFLLTSLPMSATIWPELAKELYSFLRTRFRRIAGFKDPVDTLFDRSHLLGLLFPGIPHPEASCTSFTSYKKHTAKGLYIKMSTGLGQVQLTSQGLCVSLNMPGFKIEDVTSTVENDNRLSIEGKTDTECYVAGMLIPEGFETKNHMIKTEMHQGVYTATLPRKTDD